MTPSTRPGRRPWQVGAGSGEFSYDYPFELPSVMGVPTPSLGLSYSSGSVDAMTTVENGQSGQAGMGWDMPTGYVSRSYASCRDDGHQAKGDLCGKSRDGELVEDYRIVLAGPPSWKPNLGKYQANFEYWVDGQVTRQPMGNGHFDITDMTP